MMFPREYHTIIPVIMSTSTISMVWAAEMTLQADYKAQESPSGKYSILSVMLFNATADHHTERENTADVLTRNTGSILGNYSSR